MKNENMIYTSEEQGFINVIELALDWSMEVSDKDYQRYLELTKRNATTIATDAIRSAGEPDATKPTESVQPTDDIKSYVVCINSEFVRDAQYFVPEYPLEEGEDYDEKMASDNNWNDSCNYGLFLGIYKWNTGDLDGLKSYIAAKHDVFSESLLIIPVE